MGKQSPHEPSAEESRPASNARTRHAFSQSHLHNHVIRLIGSRPELFGARTQADFGTYASLGPAAGDMILLRYPLVLWRSRPTLQCDHKPEIVSCRAGAAVIGKATWNNRQGVRTMKTDAALAIVAAGFLVFGGLSAWAEDKVDPALAKAVSEATVPLEQAIKTSEREGKPISGKYEIKSGAFQLSVYTTKGGEFKEVIVDHKSGSITKTEPITNAGDLQQAKEQAQSLVHARVPLDIGVGQAVRGNSGYRAIEVVATVDRAGKPVAFVTLTKGDDVKKVTEGLE